MTFFLVFYSWLYFFLLAKLQMRGRMNKMVELNIALGLEHNSLSRAPVIKEERNYFREH